MEFGIFRYWLELGLEGTGTFSSSLPIPITEKVRISPIWILPIAARGSARSSETSLPVTISVIL